MNIEINESTNFPDGVHQLSYTSSIDDTDDWALIWPGGNTDVCVVHIHGHGSTGDQLFTRPDLRDTWLSYYRLRELTVLSPNLRGNSWMSPKSVFDLNHLLKWVRIHYGVQKFYFVSGSMGGTSNLIYGSIHPEDVAMMVALCPATDIAHYYQWCVDHSGGIIDEIRFAIESSYEITSSKKLERFLPHRAILHYEQLSMPILVIHGTADNMIPVEQSRRLSAIMKNHKHFKYIEIPEGGHDSPNNSPEISKWIDTHLRLQEQN